MKGKKALKDSDLGWTAKTMHDILLSADRILLEFVMLGNLSRDKRSIYLIWKVDQAEVSEFGWTKLAEGYIHNAGGFSHYPAGLSNEFAQKTTHSEWDKALAYLVQDTIYCKNLDFVVSQLQVEAEAQEQQASDLAKHVPGNASSRRQKPSTLSRKPLTSTATVTAAKISSG